jgi:hypothetical protein
MRTVNASIHVSCLSSPSVYCVAPPSANRFKRVCNVRHVIVRMTEAEKELFKVEVGEELFKI